MPALVKKNTYETLIADIATLYESAREQLVETYWKIGKRIVEVDQAGNTRAPHGARLIESLSRDLSKKCGAGFSETNLKRMRRFYLAHQKRPTLAELSWSQEIALLGVKDHVTREKISARIVKGKTSARAVSTLVKNERGTGSVAPLAPIIPGPLFSYTRVPKAKIHDFCGKTKGSVVIDFGFNVWRAISKKELTVYGMQLHAHGLQLTTEPSYTYVAHVESVIDADTLWVQIDCGCDTIVREKLRLAHINAPETKTRAGDRAKRFVKRRLPPGTPILIVTSKSDKYDRYLADVFFVRMSTHKKTNRTRICEHIKKNGVYLNQELLDKGLAAKYA